MSAINSSAKTAIDTPAVAFDIANFPKISRSIPVAVPAGTLVNGQIEPASVELTVAGTNFYVRSCSAPVLIQSQRAGNAGSQNIFGTAQGQTVAGGFNVLKVSNNTALPVVALIWIGFENFINDQLTLASTTNFDIVYPTSPLAGNASILIPNLSGTKVSITGKDWYLVNRQAVLIGNPDAAATYILQSTKSPVTTAPFPGFPVYPQTSLNIPATAGDFSISAGGGAVNAYAWEIYSAFAAT